MKIEKVITKLEDLTPDWLTAVLNEAGALVRGQVTAVESDEGKGNWSKNSRLTIHYSSDAFGECPTRLFLKMVNTDLGDGEYFLPAEVTYYARDYIDVPDVPLVRCYSAANDPKANRYHILLDDLTETHDAAYEKEPNLEHGQAVVEGLAIMHARWWGADKLNQIQAPIHDPDHLNAFVLVGEEGIKHTLHEFGSKLKPHWPHLIGKLFAKLPGQLAKRAEDPTHFTLIHGDPNTGNILVPKEGERPIFLIDQQPFDYSLTTWFGVYDLAYLLALHWPVEKRRELQEPVLRHYHKTLVKRGVDHYAWEQLFEDYRLAVATMVPVAVEYMCDGGDPDWNWFRFGLIEKSLTAFDDLGCENLF